MHKPAIGPYLIDCTSINIITIGSRCLVVISSENVFYVEMVKPGNG